MLKEVYNKDLKREYQITIPAGEVSKALEEAIQKKIKTSRYPGFRVGKAPAWLVKQHEKDLVDNVVINQVYKTWSTLKKDNKIDIFEGNERVKDINIEDYKNNDEDIKFTIECELMPEITIINMDDIKIIEREFEITDDDVTKYLEKVKSGSYLEREAEDDYVIAEKDVVYADFTGEINGKLFKGSKLDNFSVRVGEGKILDDLEKSLVGLKKGDHKEVITEFPSDYHDSSVAGKKATFYIKVNKAVKSMLISTDEQLLEKFKCKDKEELSKIVHDALKAQCDEKLKNEQGDALKKALFEEYDFLIPDSLKEKQKKVLKQLPQYADLQPEDLEKEVINQAKVSLLFSKFAHDNKIQVTESEVTQYILKMSHYQQDYAKYLVDMYKNNKELASRILLKVLEDKIVSNMLKKAAKEKIKVSASEILEEKKTERGGIDE